uniref:Uncharacterized protein n=1 Tax=Aegilops tauschii subsp. strangulata TaxID=200361 RepID=A0A453RZK0_AEGTS
MVQVKLCKVNQFCKQPCHTFFLGRINMYRSSYCVQQVNNTLFVYHCFGQFLPLSFCENVTRN